MCHPCVPCSIVVVRFCFPARRPRVQIIGGFGVENIAFAWQRAFADEYRTKSTGIYTLPSGMQFSGWKKVPRCCIPCLCDLAVKIALRPIFRGCRFGRTKKRKKRYPQDHPLRFESTLPEGGHVKKSATNETNKRQRTYNKCLSRCYTVKVKWCNCNQRQRGKRTKRIEWEG